MKLVKITTPQISFTNSQPLRPSKMITPIEDKLPKDGGILIKTPNTEQGKSLDLLA